MSNLSAAYLCQITSDIFQAAGVPETAAHIVADSLVEANLTGHDSHGVIRVVEYLSKIRGGKIDPRTEPEIIDETATTLRVDGHWCFGQISATWIMERLIAKANEHSLAAGALFHCGHVGRVGTYPAMAADEGLIGFAFVNGGGTQPRVAPFGGIRPVLSTNPLAAAVPIDGQPPIVLDFSTSMVASGKIRVVRKKGEQVPEGWILDREGRPTRDPDDYYNGGMLLPAAGHKGYALNLLVEVLGGLLTGAGSLTVPESGYEVGNGVFFLVINVEAFRPLSEFTAQVRELSKVIKATPPMDEGGAVLLPGEPEQKKRARRLTEGIPIPDGTWQTIVDTAHDLGIDLQRAFNV